MSSSSCSPEQPPSQIGTASYWDPCATEKIADELREWCEDHSITRLADLIGGLIVE